MVIGYDKAQPIFIEPMITKAMLEEKAGFDLPIPGIPGMSGNYAHVITSYSIHYTKLYE